MAAARIAASLSIAAAIAIAAAACDKREVLSTAPRGFVANATRGALQHIANKQVLTNGAKVSFFFWHVWSLTPFFFHFYCFLKSRLFLYAHCRYVLSPFFSATLHFHQQLY